MLVLIPSVSNVYASGYSYKELLDVLGDGEFFIFNLRFDSLSKKNDLENNEFIFNDKLTVCYLTILEKKPESFSIKPLTINIISPSKKIYNGTFEDFGIDYYIVQFPFTLENDSSITLNETGNWWILINFNKSDSLMTWFFSGSDSRSFTENSSVELFRGFSINVLSNSDYQQYKSAKASEKAANALEKNAISAEDGAFWSKISTGALITAAIIAIISIIIQKRISNEKIKEDKIIRDEVEKTRIRKIKADCKLKMSEGLLGVQFILYPLEEFLNKIKNNKYKYYRNAQKEAEKIFDELEKHLNKVRVGLVYVYTFPEARELYDDVLNLSKNNVIVGNLLKKLIHNVNKKDVDEELKEVKNLREKVTNFLLKTIQ